MKKDKLIEKWLNNALSEAEFEAFKQLDDYQFNIDIIESAQHFKASRFSEVEDFSVFKSKYQAQDVPVRKINWLHTVLRIASVIVIAFGIFFTFFFNNQTHINTLAAEKTAIELPDKSQVVLNALTDIEYSRRKWDDKRSLKLDGEAFFKVAKGKQFDVITSDGVVSVVGTQFNVKQRNEYFEVVCYEGIVEVTSDTIIRKLSAGDTYAIIKGRFEQGSTRLLEPEWTNNISSFDRIPFDEVVYELERQYNIKIILKSVNVNRLFSGGFTHDNLDEALISITQPMNLSYELNSSNRMVIYGQDK